MVVLYLNINFALLKLLLLLVNGDVERNPGPTDYCIQKAVNGSFHQGHSKFGNTSGIQRSCNSLFAICWSSIMRVSLWKSWDLDFILEQGDAIFKNLNIGRPLSIEELPDVVFIDGRAVNLELLSNVNQLLGASYLFENHKNDIGNGLIFTTSGFSFSLIWAKQAVYLFDPHSRDSNRSFTPDGSSVLLAFKSLVEVEQYVKTEYSKHVLHFNESQFDLQYVQILIEPDSSSAILSNIRTLKNTCSAQTYRKKIRKQLSACLKTLLRDDRSNTSRTHQY